MIVDIRQQGLTSAIRQATIIADRKIVYDVDEKVWYYGDGATLGGILLTSSGETGINYVTNPRAQSNTSGWTTYDDGAVAQPVDGTGGSPVVTFGRNTTTNPLRGAADFILTKDAANRQGQGVGTPITIANADKLSQLSVTFNYSASANYASGDVGIYLYDITNASMYFLGWLLPAAYGKFVAQCWATTSTSYRLIAAVVTTSALAYTIQMDDVVVGPSIKTVGPAMSDMVNAGAITITGSTTNPIKGPTIIDVVEWRREGDSVRLRYNYKQIAAGTAGSGTYYIGVPAGIVIDSAKVYASFAGAGASPVGYARIASTAGGYNSAAGVHVDTSGTKLWVSSSASVWGSSAYPLTDNDLWMTVDIVLPVVGWSSGVVSTQARTIRLCESYAMTRVTTTPAKLGEYRSYVYQGNGVFADGAPGTAVSPANGFLAGGSSAYANADSAGYCGKWEVFIGKNKRWHLEVYENAGRTGAASFDTNSYGGFTIGSMVCYDPTTGILTVCKNTNSAATSAQYIARTPASVALTLVYFDIIVSDPACVAELPPAVSLRYKSNSGQIIPDMTSTIVLFGTADYDTHGAYNPATGRFVPPVVGKYLVKASLQTIPAIAWVAGDWFQLDVWKNGAQYVTLYVNIFSASLTSGWSGNGSDIMLLTPQDYLEFKVSIRRGGNTTTLYSAVSNVTTVLAITQVG